jgi:hypothetical protein
MVIPRRIISRYEADSETDPKTTLLAWKYRLRRGASIMTR